MSKISDKEQHMEGQYLGFKVRDEVTGFRGIAVAYLKYLNGCEQYCVKPRVAEDGKMLEGEYVDCDQLEVIGAGLWDEEDFDFETLHDFHARMGMDDPNDPQEDMEASPVTGGPVRDAPTEYRG